MTVNGERNPDEDYDNASEKSIIADLDHMDAMKAELREWKAGPWVRKSDHAELCERFSSLARKYREAEEETGRLRLSLKKLDAAISKTLTESKS